MSARPPKPENLAPLIFNVRGEKVLLDADLADLYGVEARALNQAVARNRDRFPDDFMFQLSADEHEGLRTRFMSATKVANGVNSSQTVMSSGASHSKSTGVPPSNWSQFVTTS